MSVTLFGIGLAAVLACASFVAYWYGWRFAKMMFYSATVNALGGDHRVHAWSTEDGVNHCDGSLV